MAVSPTAKLQKFQFKAGATSQSIMIYIENSSTGAGLTGLAYNTASLKAYYAKAGAASAVINLATQTTTGAWSSAGFVEEDATNMQGWYRFDLPNAVISTAVSVSVVLQGATNMTPCNIEVDCHPVDANMVQINGSATNGNNATLSLAALNITNSAGTAFVCKSTGSNGIGMDIAGNGSGQAILATGGATGEGVKATSAGNFGIYGLGGTNSAGIKAEGNGSGAGLSCAGGATGAGGIFTGGGTSGSGIRCNTQAGNSVGFYATGFGTGAGMQLTAGATGVGALIAGGATSGAGMTVSATSGDGVTLTAGGAGIGLSVVGAAQGLKVIGGSSYGAQLTGGTNFAGLRCEGNGSGAGFVGIGGATGTGGAFTGGGTSGRGLNITTTNGEGIYVGSAGASMPAITATSASFHGISITGTGASSDGIIAVGGRYDINADIQGGLTGNITGSLSGSVGSVTGAVGSVTGNVGGSVASVTGNVTANPAYISVGTGIGQLSITSGTVNANVTQISGDSTAADNLEADYDGTAQNANLPVSSKVVRDTIESQRGHHTYTGNIYYVDPISGNDTTGNGSRGAPYATIVKAHSVCTSNNHDIIFLIPNSGGGPTTFTESSGVTISKNYVFVRGPGRDALVTRTGAGTVITVTGDGCELSGFRVETAGASSNCVDASGSDFLTLHRMWLENATQDGLYMSVCTNAIIDGCSILGAGRDGIRIDSGAGTGTRNVIVDCVLRDNTGSAVNLIGSDASECRIQGNVMRDNGVGVTVGSGVLDTVISDNRQINNTDWILDAGTRTYIEWNDLQTDPDGYVIVNTASEVSYFPDTATRTVGDNDGGTVSDLQSQNGVCFTTGENATTGLEVRVSVDTSDETATPRRVTVRARYSGGAAHEIRLYKYDYANATEVLLTTYTNAVAFSLDTFDLTGDDQETGTGKMELRFRHNVETYNATHQFLIDYVKFDKLITMSGVVDANVVSVEATPLGDIADAVWDEPTSGHNTGGTFGKKLKNIAEDVIHEGTCQAGSTINTIVLDTGASATNGAYDPAEIFIREGTGAGQSRMIFEYIGASRTAIVDRDWKTTPDNTSQFVIMCNPGREHVNEGLATGGGTNTITLNSYASSYDDSYVGQLVFLRSGTGEDQVARVTAYNGTTKVATVDHDWDVVPDTTSAYAMLPDNSSAAGGSVTVGAYDTGLSPGEQVLTDPNVKINADLFQRANSQIYLENFLMNAQWWPTGFSCTYDGDISTGTSIDLIGVDVDPYTGAITYAFTFGTIDDTGAWTTDAGWVTNSSYYSYVVLHQYGGTRWIGPGKFTFVIPHADGATDKETFTVPVPGEFDNLYYCPVSKFKTLLSFAQDEDFVQHAFPINFLRPLNQYEDVDVNASGEVAITGNITVDEAAIATAVVDKVIEDNGAGTTWTLKEALRLMFSFLVGERAGGGQTTNPKTFKVPGGTKTRVSMVTTAKGNSTGTHTLDDTDA